jgi:hypothetical protein
MRDSAASGLGDEMRLELRENIWNIPDYPEIRIDVICNTIS